MSLGTLYVLGIIVLLILGGGARLESNGKVKEEKSSFWIWLISFLLWMPMIYLAAKQVGLI